MSLVEWSGAYAIPIAAPPTNMVNGSASSSSTRRRNFSKSPEGILR